LKNELARGTPEYCKWNVGCRGTPVGDHWANFCLMIVSNENAGIDVGLA